MRDTNAVLSAKSNQDTDARLKVGAVYHPDAGCHFGVWAPLVGSVAVHLYGPDERLISLARTKGGYHHTDGAAVYPGTRYKYRLDGGDEYPDPASRFQPDGVHGASQVISHEFPWTDQKWTGLPLQKLVLYELHTGTYTPEGTFDGIIPHLSELRAMGITGIELMPVAQFPGDRNWGYDGVYPFAVQNSYGGPDGLKRLVDAAHAHGLTVILDVVQNHLGPEGNYFWQFGPYFTDRYQTPWGPAVNFDGEQSSGVRRFVVENAVAWVRDYHIDGLRLDAVHSIFDASPRHILQEISETVHAEAERLGRRIQVFAESNTNDVRLVRSVASGGMGMDAEWNDDFHHALHVVLTGEEGGYYLDFQREGIGDLATALQQGYVYTGQYSQYRKRAHGSWSGDIPAQRFVVCAQNHDQVGNRMMGERLTELVSFDALKLAAATVLLSPYIPLLFMGEEYGETAPFLYFVSHSDAGLIEAVRRGRQQEFAAFRWKGEVPDPQAVETFRRSGLDHTLKSESRHAVLCRLYGELIRCRERLWGEGANDPDSRRVTPLPDAHAVVMEARGTAPALVVLHYGSQEAEIDLAQWPGQWRKVLDSAAPEWLGPGTEAPASLEAPAARQVKFAAKSFALFWMEEN